MVAVLVLALVLAQAARSEPPPEVQQQVNFLLRYVEGSRCEFYRNGSWYDSAAAQAHLRDKYDYLASRNAINTAEDFIARAASVSSFSGQPYQVRCGDRATVSSSQWLGEELARLRTTQ